MNGERGFTLIELLVAVALGVVLIAALAAFALGDRPFALRHAVTTTAALLDRARAVAATSGNGATIVAAADATGTTLTLYPTRPQNSLADVAAESPPVRLDGVRISLSPDTSGAQFALFVDSAGTVSGASYDGTSALAAEPPCATPLPLVFDNGRRRETHTTGCGAVNLQ